MSIVERAALDLLGPVGQPERDPLAGRGADAPGPGVIERAASSWDKQRPGLRLDRNPLEERIFAPEQAQATQRVSPVLHIDLEALRRQGMLTPDAGRTPISESFRRIKRQLLANVANPKALPGANCVMVTSAMPKEGKTFCTINLAISIAMETDRTVVLVDADVARPSIKAALGIEAETERGFMDVLLDGADISEVLCKTDIGKLSILTAGTRHTHATEALASKAMRELLEEMAGRYADRILIFDSPPLLAASEASVLASRMGQILVVVEAGKTTESMLKDALSRIDSSNVVGVLLNKGAPPGSSFLGGYGYGYGESG